MTQEIEDEIRPWFIWMARQIGGEAASKGWPYSDDEQPEQPTVFETMSINGDKS